MNEIEKRTKERERGNAERKREDTKRSPRGPYGKERREEESRACNIASGNVAHYLVAALTICTVDHPQQCLSFESGRKEKDA